MKIVDFIKNNVLSTDIKTDSKLINLAIYEMLFDGSKDLEFLFNKLSCLCVEGEFIDKDALRFYLNTNFEIDNNDTYYLNENEFKKIEKYKVNEALFEELINASKEELENNIIAYKDNYDKAIISGILYSYFDDDEILLKAKAHYFDSLYVYSTYKEMYNEYIKKIKDYDLTNCENYLKNAKLVSHSKYQSNVINMLHITKFGDLIGTDFETFMLIIIDDFAKYLNALCNIDAMTYNLNISNIVTRAFKMNYNQKMVMSKRIKDFNSQDVWTLQQLGDYLNITRERVRQIEAKLVRQIKGYNIQDDFITMIFRYLDLNNDYYVSVDVLEKFINNYEIVKIIKIYFLNNEKQNVICNLEYDILYDKSQLNIEQVISNVGKNIPLIVYLKDYMKYNRCEQAAINNNYRLNKKGFYLKKNYNERDIFLALIDEYFPNGYHISSDEDFNKLQKVYNDTYNTKVGISRRYIAIAFERNENYCLCDRGTYIRHDKCPQLSDELLNKIIDYINTSKYNVYYSELFNKFRIELAMLKINNQFLLKGLLDRKLPNNFHTSRDTIRSENKISKWDAIIDYMQSQPSVFSTNDINRNFPNLQYTILQGIITSEQKNGLIILYDKKLVYAKNTNVEILRDTLKPIIEKTFDELNTNYLSSYKLYSKIVLSGNDILKKCNFSIDEFNIYSVVKYLYPNDYLYRRPIISRADEEVINTTSIIRKYLLTLDSFDDVAFNNYIRKMQYTTRFTYEYQELCDYMSDEFVQVDKKNMVKKDLINIDMYMLERIENNLDDLLNKYPVFNVSDFNVYFIFPKIDNYRWNEYMVVGIINTYLDEKYEYYIENSKIYIRRLNYEL